MAQYIDKSALVAEIEKMLQEEYPCDNPEQTTGYHCALYELQDYLDTLEVKEINSTDALIEKACDYFAPHISDNSGGYDRARIIEDFKRYMEK